MSGILSSCCPFLTNAAREGRGSPPYTAEDMRIRIHNWTNSLTGSTQIPRPVKASTEERSGLPEMSAESSAITFVKSETSFSPEEGEGECKVILPARDVCPELDQVVAAVVAADFHPIPDGDWESEKGLEEEEVTLLQLRHAGDDELNVTSLERKAAQTVLLVKPQVARQSYELSSALPFKSKSVSNPPSLPHIPEQPSEPLPISVTKPTSLETPEDMSQDIPETPGSTEQMDDSRTDQSTLITVSNSSDSTSEVVSQEITEPPSSAEVMSQEIHEPPSSAEEPQNTADTPTELSLASPSDSIPPKPPLLSEDPTQPSPSTELLDAISSLSAARGAAKSRRSRMTSTRAPTPWSATEPDDDDDATDEGLDEDEQLERADSSGSSSPFESVAATTDSSYHTLPTASSSVERADQVGDQPAEEIVQPRPMAAAVADEKTAQGAEVNEMSDGGRETHTDTTDTTETEVTEEDNSTTPRNTATHPAAPTEPANRTQPSSGLAVEPPLISLPPEQAAHSTGAPAGRAVTGGATAAGDQPPTITISDDVSLRYFCGTFQPADHHMTRYAGLEGAAAAPEPRPVPSGRSDSAVTPPGEAAAGRGRSAASDSRLGVRSSSPKPLTGEDSGVQLEAKRSTTDLPPQ